MTEFKMERAHVSYGRDCMPPFFAIQQAEEAAADSPCAKAKHGVAIYRAALATPNVPFGSDEYREIAEEMFADDCNGPPWTYNGDEPDSHQGCDGSDECRRDCSKRCVHAEPRALLAVCHPHNDRPHLLRMVHVLLGSDGKATPTKGPSCIECSKLICDAGVGGIWLYERRAADDPMGIWRYYKSKDFHTATEINIGSHRVPPKSEDETP